MKKTAWLLFGLFFVFIIVAACPEKKEKRLPDKIVLQLKANHQAQFAGFYLAKEEGYYKRENLDVQFVEGGQGIDNVRTVIEGRADFGVVAPEDILIKQSEGSDIRAVAAIYQRSAVVFVSMENSGIRRPVDFKGRTIAAAGGGTVRDFEFRLHVLMKKTGLDLSRIRIVPYDPNFKDFYSGEVDITPAYLTGGVVKMRQKGCKINLIWPDDYGIHFYSDILMTTRQMIEKYPDQVSRFVKASIAGWRDAIGDPARAVRITMKYARIQDKTLQTAMMEAMLPYVHTGEAQIGWMKSETWRHMHDIMLEQGILPAPLPDLNKAYTTQFLETVFGATEK
jgi:NitT/TauT family transport system substrate-binding protein